MRCILPYSPIANKTTNARLVLAVGLILNAKGIQPATPIHPAMIRDHSFEKWEPMPKNGATTNATD